MESTDAAEGAGVKTVRTAFEILEALKSLDGATTTEVAAHLDLPKSSAYNHLQTLEREGYVVKNDQTYELGLRLLDLGAFARQKQTLFDVAQPEMETVAEETGELVNLLVEEGGRGIFLLRERGDNAVNVDSYTGQSVHLHTTALGKTILAHLSEERRASIIERHGLPQMTEKTITDRDRLEAELEEIRTEEVAYDMEERVRGLRCVAVPIFNDETITGAVSVSGPNSRMSEDRIRDEILPQLKHAANIIELNQTYS
ncbi:IclR family transcriptional regulator [Natronolimnohabitans innermongolicus]|uniref:IclR family transcriptional regulator n=1 Tax=Natronolimnohabitans innermongolicus JCM 12255 TaxID=1227499 RepID=L9WP19_9EURY|nr:IclR family transcriptional regulator [Natronolimnohabitans innermongolicus]ELY50956.1 IclR family transcriptional regulator [Natronolimnohabitans innermongolicus JCM 12255]